MNAHKNPFFRLFGTLDKRDALAAMAAVVASYVVLFLLVSALLRLAA